MKWDDAYTLSLRTPEDGAKLTVVGRVEEAAGDHIELEAICRPEGVMHVELRPGTCGAPGDILILEGVARRFSRIESLHRLDGVTVDLVDATVSGTATVADACRYQTRVKVPR